MSLDLIDNRNLLWVFQQVLKMFFHKVAYTNILDFSLFLHFYQGSPTFQSDFSIFWVIYFEFADSWPVNEKEIKILTI